MTVVLFALVGVTRGEGGVPVACGEGEFGCVASGACISVALVCDGGSVRLVGVTRGEGGAPVACGEGQFGCVASGACISVALVCDGGSVRPCRGDPR